jgi:hypothetical protein
MSGCWCVDARVVGMGFVGDKSGQVLLRIRRNFMAKLSHNIHNVLPRRSEHCANSRL